jgi:hypothetical protein
MKTIKIKAAEYDLVVSSKREDNEEKSYEKGYEGANICGCCGKPIKNAETAKALHLIEGGSYFTEYEGEINTCHGSDMGWWTVGAACYKKYKKNEKEVEVVNED